MPVTPITSLKDFNAIIDGSKPAVIDFWAPWCGPCRMISPVFEKFSEDPGFGNLAFYKVDVDACEDISTECGVRAMPVFMVFQNGAKVDEMAGANPPALHGLVQNAARL